MCSQIFQGQEKSEFVAGQSSFSMLCSAEVGPSGWGGAGEDRGDDTKHGLTWSQLLDEGRRMGYGRQVLGWDGSHGSLSRPFSGVLCFGSLGWKFQ